MVDNHPEIQVIATGSSSFELANEIKEPLTGRKFEHFLFPISFSELVNNTGILEEKRVLKHRLVYGSYPEVLNNPGTERITLSSLADSYLYKDILVWKNIKKPLALEKLLKALAFQMEIDLIEEREGKLFAYEIKWNPKASYRFPRAFMENYPEHNTSIISTDNYDQFLSF